YLGKNPAKASKYLENTSYSKYGINFSFAAEAPKMAIPEFELILDSDSVIDNLRNIQFTMVPRRKVNRIELYNNEDISFNSLEFNGRKVELADEENVYRGVKNTALVNYYVSPNDSLKVKFSVEKETPISFKVMEYSFDIMDNPEFNIKKRPLYTMPKPFVITDAIAVKRTFSIDSLNRKTADTLNSQTILIHE